jgi:hypothetical protein
MMKADIGNVHMFWDMDDHYFRLSKFEAEFNHYESRPYTQFHLHSAYFYMGLEVLTAVVVNDASDMFIRNVGLHTDYTALCSRRWTHSSLRAIERIYAVSFTVYLPPSPAATRVNVTNSVADN